MLEKKEFGYIILFDGSDYMTEKELKGYVLKLFKYKSISSKQFMTAKNNLEQIKEFDELFYYFNMGKFQSTFGIKLLKIRKMM